MKKLFYILFLISSVIYGQTLEHTFPGNSTVRILYQDLGGGDYKFIVLDQLQSKFDIYNLDYTPYLLNITTALPLTGGEHDIAYISKNLFDCDETTIEYVLIHDFSDFKVFRTNGDLIFSKDDVTAIYCFGCNNGSNTWRPIYNTPAGTKLILMDRTNNSNYIYGLCGELPLSINEITQTNFVTIYPVPNNNLNFKISLPYQTNSKEISIYDVNMRQLDKFEFSESNIDISKNYNFPSGIYFYVLKSSGNILESGKFIVQ